MTIKKILLSGLLLFMASYSLANKPNLNDMPERYIKKLDRYVNFLGLGTVELGRPWGIAGVDSMPPSESMTQSILINALESGVNVIDTASSYGSSEQRIGHYIPRNKFDYLLITKPGEHNVKHPYKYLFGPFAEYDFSYDAIVRDITESLANLQTDTLDVALLHLDNKTALEVLEKGEATQALLDLKAQGKIKYIGVSVNGPAAQYAIDMNFFDVIEMEYNLLNQKNKLYIDSAYAKGMGVIVRGGLGTGLLTPYIKKHIDDTKLPYGDKIRALLKLTHDDYDKLTELALAFLYQNAHISSIIVGADRVELLHKDIRLIKQFNEPQLLKKAIALMSQFPTPEFWTENMGEYYF